MLAGDDPPGLELGLGESQEEPMLTAGSPQVGADDDEVDILERFDCL